MKTLFIVLGILFTTPAKDIEEKNNKYFKTLPIIKKSNSYLIEHQIVYKNIPTKKIKIYKKTN